MAIFAFRIGSWWRVIGDGEDDFLVTRDDRLEWVETHGGNDRIIMPENGLIDTGSRGPFSRGNPLWNPGDIVDAGSGDDTIISEATLGIIYGGDGDDAISSAGPSGPDGIELLIYGDVPDPATSGHGDDVISAGAPNEFIDGGGGNDTIVYDLAAGGISLALGEPDAIQVSQFGFASGGSGDDTLLRIENAIGSRFDDILTGNDVANRIEGNLGDDTIRGGDADDTIRGGQGDDILLGQSDDDDIFGGSGNDDLSGGPGNDLLVPGAGQDVVDGGIGIDRMDLRGSDGPVFVNLAQGFVRTTLDFGVIEIDTVSSVENVDASPFSDAIFGNGLRNSINGFEGNDQIAGLDHDDVISGGAGQDILFGNQGMDALSGGAHADILFGGVGNDILVGNDGDDALAGGPGSDLMTGGDGQDQYVWGPEDFGDLTQDTIFGFVPVFDTLVFQGIFDPDEAVAADLFSALQEGDDVVLTIDLSGTPAAQTVNDVDLFVRLDDFGIDDVDFGLWQAIGAIEFI